MTQVQTIGGLKRGRGRGRGSGRGRGGGRSTGRGDKPGAFEAFKGAGFSLNTQESEGIQQQQNAHSSGVFAAEQQHLAGIAKLQQQHDEALALRAVQLAELQKQQQEEQATSSASTQHQRNVSAQTAPQPQAATSADVIDLCGDEPAQQSSTVTRPPAKPREKMSWSLGVDHPTFRTTPSNSVSSDNPFWCPARYVPVGGENQADLHLQTHEVVLVFDNGLVGHRGTAVLDTGGRFLLVTVCMMNCLSMECRTYLLCTRYVNMFDL